MQHCHNCGAEVAQGSRFCIQCGAPVPQDEGKGCHSCGARMKEGDRFCMRCGAAQTVQPASRTGESAPVEGVPARTAAPPPPAGTAPAVPAPPQRERESAPPRMSGSPAAAPPPPAGTAPAVPAPSQREPESAPPRMSGSPAAASPPPAGTAPAAAPPPPAGTIPAAAAPPPQVGTAPAAPSVEPAASQQEDGFSFEYQAPTSRERVCPRCSAECGEQDNVCSVCGFPLQQTPQLSYRRTGRGGRIVLFVILGIVILAVAGLLVWQLTDESSFLRGLEPPWSQTTEEPEEKLEIPPPPDQEDGSGPEEQIHSENEPAVSDQEVSLSIEPRWEEAGPFQEGGVAWVKEEGLWGLINSAGDYLIQPTYQAAGRFSEGMAAVLQDGLYGYVSASGRVEIPFQFEEAREFSNGLAAVRQGGNYGFIALDGQLVIPAEYLNVRSFAGQYAPVQTAEGWGYVNVSGELEVEGCDQAEVYSEGLAPICIDSVWGYTDEDMRLAIELLYQTAGPFVEGLAVVSDGEDTFFIDREGQECSVRVDQLSQYQSGYAVAVLGGQYGYIDLSGEFVIPPQYTGAGAASDGLFPVCTREGQWMYVNSDNQQQFGARYQYAFPFENGIARVIVDGLYGIIDSEGREVEPAHWDELEEASHGLMAARVDDEWGYLSLGAAD